MKKAVPIFLLVGAVIAFSSCKMQGPKVISSDGKSYEMITAEDGGRVTNENGDLVVAATDAQGNDTTEVVTDDYLIVSDDKLMAPAYDMEIPDDFELKSSDTNPLLENKQGTIQFNIMDKTKAANSFDEYVNDAYNSAVTAGLTTDKLEDVTIKGYPMKRFSMTMPDDDGIQLTAYGYLVQVNERILMITLTSKDGGLADVSAADKFVEGIEFVS